MTTDPDEQDLVHRAAPDGAEAEAVVQEAWLRAWKNRRRCAPNRPFFPWLASIAMNVARDGWRKRRPLDFADLGDVVEEIPEAGLSAEGRLEAAEARERLAKYVDELR